MTEIPDGPVAQTDMRELRKAQNTHKCIGFWVRAVKDKKLPDKSNLQSKADLAMLMWHLVSGTTIRINSHTQNISKTYRNKLMRHLKLLIRKQIKADKTKVLL